MSIFITYINWHMNLFNCDTSTLCTFHIVTYLGIGKSCASPSRIHRNHSSTSTRISYRKQHSQSTTIMARSPLANKGEGRTKKRFCWWLCCCMKCGIPHSFNVIGTSLRLVYAFGADHHFRCQCSKSTASIFATHYITARQPHYVYIWCMGVILWEYMCLCLVRL